MWMHATGRRRRARTAVLALATAAAAWVAGSSPASACSCVPPPPPETALTEADAVFTGEVTDISERRSELGRIHVATIEVDEVFAGDVREVVEVHTPVDSATCGHAFAVGRAELVYGLLDDEGRLQTNLCLRTAPVAEAEADLAALGEGEDPAAGPADPVDADGGWLLPAGVALLVVAAAAVTVALRRRT